MMCTCTVYFLIHTVYLTQRDAYRLVVTVTNAFLIQSTALFVAMQLLRLAESFRPAR